MLQLMNICICTVHSHRFLTTVFPRFDVNVTTPYLISDSAFGVVGIVSAKYGVMSNNNKYLQLAYKTQNTHKILFSSLCLPVFLLCAPSHTAGRPVRGNATISVRLVDQPTNVTYATMNRFIPYVCNTSLFVERRLCNFFINANIQYTVPSNKVHCSPYCPCEYVSVRSRISYSSRARARSSCRWASCDSSPGGSTWRTRSSMCARRCATGSSTCASRATRTRSSTEASRSSSSSAVARASSSPACRSRRTSWCTTRRACRLCGRAHRCARIQSLRVCVRVHACTLTVQPSADCRRWTT